MGSRSRVCAKSFARSRTACLALATAAGVFQASSAFATTDNWTNAAGGSWGDNGNWSLGAPSGGNDVAFNLGSASGYTVTIPAGLPSNGNIGVRTDRVTFSLGGNKLQTSGPFSGTVSIGATAGENASLTVSGTNPTSGLEYFDGDYDFNVGTAGTGALTVDDALVRSTHGAITIGATGSLTAQNGAVLQPNLTSYIFGSASLDQSLFRSAPLIICGTLSMTNHASTDASLPAFQVTGATAAATATVTINNSSVTSAIYVGHAGQVSKPGKGSITVTNGGSLRGSIRVGNGTVTASGAGTTITDSGFASWIGQSGTSGSVAVSAGAAITFDNASGLAEVVGGNTGTGSLSISGTGSSLTVGNALNVGVDTANRAGTGLLQLDNKATGSVGGTLTIAAGGTFKVLSGATLAAVNLNLASAGATDFTGGTLKLTGGTLTAAALSVGSTTTLAGKGTITGDVTSAGTIAPTGSPTGLLTINGNLTDNAGSKTNMQLGGTTPATQYDQLHVGGALAFGGTLTVSLVNSFTPTANQSFDLLDFASHTGTFAALDLPNAGAGASWDTSQLYTTGVVKLTALMMGDTNLDGAVGVTDLGDLASHYGATSGATWRDGDFGNNGSVDVSDLGDLASNYGQAVAGRSSVSAQLAIASPAASVPEPTSAAMLIASASLIGLRSRRRRR